MTTRTQQIVMLLEATGPLTMETLLIAMQWPRSITSGAVRRLVAMGIVRHLNIDGRRHYAMV